MSKHASSHKCIDYLIWSSKSYKKAGNELIAWELYTVNDKDTGKVRVKAQPHRKIVADVPFELYVV